jgi:hypothetical protein
MLWMVAALVPLAVACARPDGNRDTASGEGLQIRFEEQAAPGVFSRRTTARRDARDGTPGLWAAVPRLPRPESGRIENIATGDTVTVALFAAPRNANASEIRISDAAAQAIGMTGATAQVLVTAVRTEPRIGAAAEGF